MTKYRLATLAATLLGLAACAPVGSPPVAYQPQRPDYPAIQATPGYAYQPAQQGTPELCCIASREVVVQSYVPRRPPAYHARVGCLPRNPCAPIIRTPPCNPCDSRLVGSRTTEGSRIWPANMNPPGSGDCERTINGVRMKGRCWKTTN